MNKFQSTIGYDNLKAKTRVRVPYGAFYLHTNEGKTFKAVRKKIKRARRVTRTLNLAGIFVILWIVLFPDYYYEYVILLSIALPIISITAVIYFEGLIRIDSVKGSKNPDVSILGILMPVVGLGFIAVESFNILDYSKVWIFSSVIAIVMVLFVTVGTKQYHFKNPKDYFSIFLFVVLFFGYGYGVTVTMNCTFDRSTPEVYEAKVIGKWANTGRWLNFYLVLGEWGPQTESDDVDVPKYLYDEKDINDTVKINFKKGLFNIPWFSIIDSSPSTNLNKPIPSHEI